MTKPEAEQTTSTLEIEQPTLGQFLAQCRQDKGWSISIAAKKIGISPVYLRKIEKDQVKSPGLLIAYDFAQNYGVSIDTLADVHERQEENEAEEKIRELERKIEEAAGIKIHLDLETVSRLSKNPIHSKKLYLEFLSLLAS
ncbi:MAG: helix-turn-helix domain-containing protein [Candidatus Marinimicrobia bacterium]|nr:helix-turn-helix domain-containing protein [Candidatus Neomarinimicrobiota bacterium]